MFWSQSSVESMLLKALGSHVVKPQARLFLPALNFMLWASAFLVYLRTFHALLRGHRWKEEFCMKGEMNGGSWERKPSARSGDANLCSEELAAVFARSVLSVCRNGCSSWWSMWTVAIWCSKSKELESSTNHVRGSTRPRWPVRCNSCIGMMSSTGTNCSLSKPFFKHMNKAEIVQLTRCYR